MSNYLGNYSLYIALIASVYLIFKSYLDANSENKYLDKKPNAEKIPNKNQLIKLLLL